MDNRTQRALVEETWCGAAPGAAASLVRTVAGAEESYCGEPCCVASTMMPVAVGCHAVPRLT